MQYRFNLIPPVGQGITLAYHNPHGEGYVGGVPEIEGIDTPHLMWLNLDGVLSTHITYQKSQEHVHISNYDFNKIPETFPESVMQSLVREVPSDRLSENVFYTTQNFSDMPNSVWGDALEKRVSPKKITYALNTPNLLDRLTQLAEELKQSPSLFLGICTAEELLEDDSKIELTDSNLVVMSIEGQLYYLDFSFILDFNPQSTNPLSQIYRSTGISQYMQIIEKNGIIKKLLSKT
jgi:hypothetical protein